MLAYAIDVVAGSPLTALSLIGPNPALGVRFFGIGNELEATLAPLVPLGTGAALAGLRRRRASPRGAARVAFLRVARCSAALVFAPGGFGADVGAAIVLPGRGRRSPRPLLGGRRRRWPCWRSPPRSSPLGPARGDRPRLGGDAHLTRSVLEAGGLDDLADVAERRLRLSAMSFGAPRTRPSSGPCWRRSSSPARAAAPHRVAWFEGARRCSPASPAPPPRPRVGTLANDSGALLLMIGTAYLLAFAGYAWAEQAESGVPAR